MRWISVGMAALALSACVSAVGPRDGGRADGQAAPPAALAPQPAAGRDPRAVAANFIRALERVEPVAEGTCRARTRGVPCDFRIVIDTRPDAPPNAFQSVDAYGQPVIAFTLSLVESTRNLDEIAFIAGHEAAHHILGHIPLRQRNAEMAQILAGLTAALGGADAAGVARAQSLGAAIGARQFSQEFELQADALGTEIAFLAGFDPVLGAAFFSRLPDPGNRFLGTHPPNAARLETVRRTAAALRY